MWIPQPDIPRLLSWRCFDTRSIRRCLRSSWSFRLRHTGSSCHISWCRWGWKWMMTPQGPPLQVLRHNRIHRSNRHLPSRFPSCFWQSMRRRLRRFLWSLSWKSCRSSRRLSPHGLCFRMGSSRHWYSCWGNRHNSWFLFRRHRIWWWPALLRHCPYSCPFSIAIHSGRA